MIHFVNAKEPIGLTYCGGNIFVEVPCRDRVTFERKRVTCPACKLLLAEGALAEGQPKEEGSAPLMPEEPSK